MYPLHVEHAAQHTALLAIEPVRVIKKGTSRWFGTRQMGHLRNTWQYGPKQADYFV